MITNSLSRELKKGRWWSHGLFVTTDTKLNIFRPTLPVAISCTQPVEQLFSRPLAVQTKLGVLAVQTKLGVLAKNQTPRMLSVLLLILPNILLQPLKAQNREAR